MHVRNFSDFDPQKNKNRSFFNKYKESKNNALMTNDINAVQ